MSKTKILLAEDDATMVALLKTLLKMEDYDVVAIHADDNVVEAVRREKPGIVLMDVHLSMQSGLDVLDEIRNTADVNGTRIVMSSGASVKDECMKRGANGFLLKPYMPDDLIKLLRKVLHA